MTIPRVPLILTALGALPFLWGALTTLMPELALSVGQRIGGRFVGPYIQLSYGQVILAFMSGILWGFAARSGAMLGYVLSVIPALWAFFMVGGGPIAAAINLIAGFLAVLALDAVFARHGLTPEWWLKLRIPVTIVVVACLTTGLF